MRHTTCFAVLVAALLGWNVPAAAQDDGRVLQLQFDADGFVSLRAQHVTSREILAEWARLCGCHLVNAEGLRGDPVMVPLLFERQPQAVVLRSLLGEAAGYVLTPKRAGSTGPSEFETIYIVPTSTPVPRSYVAGPAPVMPPAPISTRGAPDNEIPPVPQAPAQPAADGQAPAETQAPAARPAGTSYPGTGLPSVFVPIVPVPSSPFAPSPARGGGSGTPATQPGQAPAQSPGQAPAQQPVPVSANP